MNNFKVAKSSWHRLAIVLAIIFLNPISLYIYTITIIEFKANQASKPQLEAKSQLFRIPNTCSLISKEFIRGWIDSSPGLKATYRCSSTAQEVFSSLSSSYTVSGENITGDRSGESLPEGNASFASTSTASKPGRLETFVFDLGTTEYSVKDNSLTIDSAIPTTKPVYLSVYISL